MKIVLCHNYYQQAGGEDSVFHDECKLLEAHGDTVVRYTLHNDAIAAMSRLSVAVHAVWNRRIARELAALVAAARADVVHFHNTFPLISPAGYYAARRAGAAVVQTLHNYRLLCPQATFFRDDRICEDCLGRFFPWPAIRHGCYRGSHAGSAVVAAVLTTHRFLRTYDREVDIYVALSEFSRRKFIAGGLPDEKVTLKPNFVTPDFGPGPGTGGYAMYLGRLSSEKGVETLLRAWERVRDVPLKVVGDGPLADRVLRATQKNSRIQWLPGRRGRAVRELIADSAFLVLPSVNYEGFPKVLVEAFAVGTPVVASRLGAMPELIEDQRTGLHFQAGDAADLACKVQTLFGQPRRLAAMRAAARRTYEEKYTADLNYQALLAIYHQALARRHSPSQCLPRVSPV